jgi:hypothetical protein
MTLVEYRVKLIKCQCPREAPWMVIRAQITRTKKKESNLRLRSHHRCTLAPVAVRIDSVAFGVAEDTFKSGISIKY